jgi:hypothetical protein
MARWALIAWAANADWTKAIIISKATGRESDSRRFNVLWQGITTMALMTTALVIALGVVALPAFAVTAFLLIGRRSAQIDDLGRPVV